MGLTGGLAVTCADENRRGGIKKLWVADRDQITLFTPAVAAHEYSAVTVGGTPVSPFFLFQFEDFTGMMSSEGSSENGSKVITRSLEFHIPKMTEPHALAAQQILDNCRVILVFEDYNAQTWVAGYDEVLEHKAALISVADEMTGTGLQDENGYILKFNGVGGEVSRLYTGATDVAPFEQTAP